MWTFVTFFLHFIFFFVLEFFSLAEKKYHSKYLITRHPFLLLLITEWRKQRLHTVTKAKRIFLQKIAYRITFSLCFVFELSEIRDKKFFSSWTHTNTCTARKRSNERRKNRRITWFMYFAYRKTNWKLLSFSVLLIQ